MRPTRTIHAKTAALLLCTALMTGCGGGSTPPATQSLQTEGATQNGSQQSSDKQNQTDNDSLREALSGVKTRGPAKDVTSSKDALFVAEGDKGVEIIKIGYKDRIDHEVLSTITGINATFVTLSADKTRLYVQNREGFVNIYNISDIHHPVRERTVTAESLRLDPVSRDGRYRFVAEKEKGLCVYDISNPATPQRIAQYGQRPVYAVVLLDDDTRALTATKTDGVDLLDITDPASIKKIGHHPIAGETLGLSVNASKGLLFVARGDAGVKLYDLKIFLAQSR